MKRGPIIHGVLLCAALLFAYQTWTRDKTVKVERGTVTLWTGSVANVQSVTYDSENKTIHVERKSDAKGDYLWGKTTRTTTPPPVKQPDPPANDAGVPEPAPEPPPAPEPKTTITEYPVGKTADELFEGLAPMKAVRELGIPSDAQREEWKLVEADTQLTVTMKSESHTLILGGKVYGGRDRYVIDPTSGKAYIVPGEVLAPFEGSDAGLRPTKALGFDPAAVATATVTAGDRTRTLVRGDKEVGHGGKQDTWAGEETPGDPDQTLANYMSNVSKLTPSEYLTDRDDKDLTLVLKVDYKDKAGKVLDSLELLKLPDPADPAKADYFIRTNTTRVLAKTLPTRAKRIDSDVGQLFGEAPSAPEPEPTPAPAPPTPAGPVAPGP